MIKLNFVLFSNFILYRTHSPYPFEVVKKLSIVVTPSMVRAGTAFHSNQNVRKEDDTRIIPVHKNRNLAPVFYQLSCVWGDFFS